MDQRKNTKCDTLMGHPVKIHVFVIVIIVIRNYYYYDDDDYYYL